MNDNDIEQEIQVKGLTAPRVTPADIEANIVGEYYFTAHDGVVGFEFKKKETGWFNFDGLPELQRLTFCALVLRNGFIVTGESYCADAERFDAETGRNEARKDAINKAWPLMVYALKERLYEESRGDKNQYIDEQIAWHENFKVGVMDALEISDPSIAIAHINALKNR